jgi:hypothetical protein
MSSFLVENSPDSCIWIFDKVVTKLKKTGSVKPFEEGAGAFEFVSDFEFRASILNFALQVFFASDPG